MRFRLFSQTATRLALTASLLFGALATALSAQAATAPAGAQISNKATATYFDSALLARTAESNTVVTTVQQVGSLTLGPSAAKSIGPGKQLVYPLTLANTGNAADTFALTHVNSGAFSMVSVKLFVDVNADGIADDGTVITTTPSLAAGASFSFVAVVEVPGSALPGQVNTLTVTGASAFAPAVKATATGTTTVTSTSQMDVTANSVGPTAPGYGPGHPTNSAADNAAPPGTTTRFSLFLTNAGGTSDIFTLDANMASTFNGLDHPAGWTVVFKDLNGATITTATVDAGASVPIYADITVRDTEYTGTLWYFYIRAKSPTTTVSDYIHVTVRVTSATNQLSLEKTQALDASCDGTADGTFVDTTLTSGAIPGACIRYQIKASNVSASDITGVVVRDDTPNNTVYYSTGAPASTTKGLVTAPLHEHAGTINVVIGTLGAGKSETVSFGVRIVP